MSYKYIKQLAHTSNYGGARDRSQIVYLVLHFTANDGDKASNNAKYFQQPNRKASAHYFVDDENVYQSVSDLYVAWSVGGARYSDCKETGGGSLYGKCTNANSISIELCDTKKNGKVQATPATINNAIELICDLMQKYSIDLEHVIRHFDVNGKKCPAYYVDNKAWQEFKKTLSERLKEANTDTSNTNTHSEPTNTIKKQFYIITAKDGLNIRAGAGTNYKKLFALTKGDKLELLEKAGDWYRVKDTAGRIGYAYAKWLEPLNA